jgi:hypothetical protein
MNKRLPVLWAIGVLWLVLVSVGCYIPDPRLEAILRDASSRKQNAESQNAPASPTHPTVAGTAARKKDFLKLSTIGQPSLANSHTVKETVGNAIHCLISLDNFLYALAQRRREFLDATETGNICCCEEFISGVRGLRFLQQMRGNS